MSTEDRGLQIILRTEDFSEYSGQRTSVSTEDEDF